MLVPAFQLHLNTPILEGLVTVGKCTDVCKLLPVRANGFHPKSVDDGKNASLTCGTAAGKVFVHCPHDRSLDSLNNLRFLNINRRLTAITAGELDPARKRDILVVGSQTNVFAYDVDANTDMFYRDVQDAASALAMGSIDNNPKPLLFVGGNCSVQGFDAAGTEAFWAVTGDTVTALAAADYRGDGTAQLVVGSADYELRFFRGEEVVHESAEADKPVALCSLGPPSIGCGGGCGPCRSAHCRAVQVRAGQRHGRRVPEDGAGVACARAWPVHGAGFVRYRRRRPGRAR
jgi:Bardet-Biedl syndrome 2 protein